MKNGSIDIPEGYYTISHLRKEYNIHPSYIYSLYTHGILEPLLVPPVKHTTVKNRKLWKLSDIIECMKQNTTCYHKGKECVESSDSWVNQKFPGMRELGLYVGNRKRTHEK